MGDWPKWHPPRVSQGLAVLLLIGLLLFLAWEDWRDRSVPIWALGCFGLALLFWIYPKFSWLFSVTNLFFVLIQLGLVVLYFRYLKSRQTAVLGEMLGWGDVVFILISALLWPTHYFLLAYLSGLILTLVVVYLSGRHEDKQYSIPLISGLAISQILTVVWMALWG